MKDFIDDIVQFLKGHVPLADAALAQAIEIPPSIQLGDYAFPCLPLAKILRKRTRE